MLSSSSSSSSGGSRSDPMKCPRQRLLTADVCTQRTGRHLGKPTFPSFLLPHHHTTSHNPPLACLYIHTNETPRLGELGHIAISAGHHR